METRGIACGFLIDINDKQTHCRVTLSRDVDDSRRCELLLAVEFEGGELLLEPESLGMHDALEDAAVGSACVADRLLREAADGDGGGIDFVQVKGVVALIAKLDGPLLGGVTKVRSTFT